MCVHFIHVFLPSFPFYDYFKSLSGDFILFLVFNFFFFKGNIPSFKNTEMFEEKVDCCLMFLCVSSLVGPHGVGASPGDKKSKSKTTRGKKKSIFETYMSKEDVSEGLKRGTLIQVLKIY